jgi:peptidoglycan/xylan/chitin deacetylase (PgdA/CDA1 family)
MVAPLLLPNRWARVFSNQGFGPAGRPGRAESLSSDDRWLASLRLELAYVCGRAWLVARKAGGAGAILRFGRVRPRRSDAFQPLAADEITPQFLDRLISALKRWDYDVIGMDEVCDRAVRLAVPRRFACLTFDGASQDLLSHAYPVLRRHGVPFTLYVPTSFPDGIGQAWWLALEAVIAREARISLMVERREQRFTVFKTSEKRELFRYLTNWLRTLPPAELSTAIRDLCTRHGIDLDALSREATLDWTDIETLAADRNVTIGSATVNYPVLSNLGDADARRELGMGKAVLENALGRSIRHVAFPFGDHASFGRAHVAMAKDVGFASAVTTVPGIVQAEGRTDLHALPRIAWDGRSRSLRAMQVLLSGAMFAPVASMRQAGIEGD